MSTSLHSGVTTYIRKWRSSAESRIAGSAIDDQSPIGGEIEAREISRMARWDGI